MYMRLLFLLLPIIMLFGCTQENREESLHEQKTTDQYVQVENTNDQEQKILNNTQIANHLAEVASSVPDVNKSTAIVLGPYAVVGLNVDKDLDRSRVGTVKYSVLEALQKDPYGKTAVVVADGDIAERIREMNNKVQQGYPVQGIMEELAAIVGRYMPNFPVPDQPTEPDQNKEKLPKDKKENLEEKQDDHSNEKADQ